ncbi:hypothetical protein DFS34DRAFT_227574 [Phlyctochytrium arcticum]|nr:hypothetical protein DFS34DRAFT_227574 [Phlyctochytrium arcticum]
MAQLKKDDAQAFQNARGNGDDGIGGFGSSTQAKETPAVPTPNKSRPTTVGGGGGNGPTGAMRASVNFMNSGTPLAGDGRKSDAAGNHGASPGANMDRTEELMQNKSVLELREQEIRQTELLFRKDRITMAIKKSVQSFDLSVDHLVKERVVLEADLKSADMKLLLLYREWVLLKEFEKHDNQLADKLSQKRNEKDEIDGKIKECQEKLNAKKAEIESVIKREKEVQEEVRRTIGENNRHEDYLTKVFKKKIKRSKKKPKAEGLDARGNGNDGEHEDEDEFDEDEEEDDMDDFDDEESGTSENNDGVEECPADWDASSFARVLALREERLDQDDILNEIQKTVEVLKKENDALLKKEKTIDMALRTTETEIQEFQTQKQQKLNELSVTIPLRLHQMQYLDKGALPSDLSPALVFVNEGLLKLRNRIKELQQERADIRKQHKELRKMHVGLIKSRKEKLQKLQELEARATDVQMLKFGQIIDLEKVERMGVNKSADELREKLAKEDAKRLKEVEIIEAEIERLREAFIEVTRENTLRLESLVDLTDTRQKLEEQLNASQLSVTAEYSGPQTKDLEEREKLVNLVHLRAQEIEDLKREIEMLIRKPMRQLPPVLRKRFETAQSMGGGLPTLPGGGMVTADGIVLDSFDMGALPPASEVILQE